MHCRRGVRLRFKTGRCRPSSIAFEDVSEQMSRQETVNQKVNILLVDDRRENLLALEGILKSLDQNLVQAMSGAQALKFLLRNDAAVILLDVEMPDMDGFQTATLIREREKTRHTPI